MSTLKRYVTDESWFKARYTRKTVRLRDGLTTVQPCSSVYRSVGEYKEVTKVVNDRGFKKLKRKQKLAILPPYTHPFLKAGLPYPNPFKVGTFSSTADFGYFEAIHQARTLTNALDIWMYGELLSTIYSGTISNFFLPMTFSTFDGQITDYTYMSALANVRSAEVDIGMSLAELVETVQFLVAPFKSILKLHKKRGLLGGTFRHLVREGRSHFSFVPSQGCPTKMVRMQRQGMKTLRSGELVINESSNFWNGYRFGMRPLLADIDNYCKLAAEGLKPPAYLQRARSKFEKHAEVHVSRSDLGWGLGAKSTITTSVQETYRTCVHYLQNRFSMMDNLDVLGLGITQVPNIVWELVPLSFVLDRFVGVSDWLAAKRPKPGTKFLGATHSKLVKKSMLITPMQIYQPSLNLAYYKTDWYGDPVNLQGEVYERQIAGPQPSLPVYNPRLLDLSQHIDHLALLWQRMPKFRR